MPCSLLLVAAFLTTFCPSASGQRTGAPREKKADVSVAPSEHSAPRAPLPATMVSAAAHLFQLGLADPRGCEYREIEVLVGAYPPEWKDSVEKTHGWVLPAKGKQPGQFGVCWNGLMYRLRSVGEAADLRADALAAATAEPQDLVGMTGWYWLGSRESTHLCNPNEARAVSYESPLPIKVCLLWRLGEIELAEKLWDHWKETRPKPSPFDDAATAGRQHLKDPYLTLANCWALSLSDRARAAHIRGDDRLSLAAAESLAKVGPALKAEARRRGFSPAAMADTVLSGEFDCVGILADQRRRARERRQKDTPAVRAGEYPDPAKFWEKFRQELDRCPDGARRIALLIRQLEEVSSKQDPGGVCIAASGSFSGVLPNMEDPSQHPISHLLAAEGDDAVEPLLACLEGDNRLTRWRPHVASWPVGVRVLAKGALERTLKVPLPEIKGEATQPGTRDDDSETPKAIAARLRDYWERYQDLPPVERWYGDLADDRARGRWLVAVRTIVQPASVPVTLDSVRYGVREDLVPYSPAGERMYGEPLRKKGEPGVTELMVQRVEGLDEPFGELQTDWRRLAEQEKQLAELEARLDQQQADGGDLVAKFYEQQEKLQERRKELEKREDELRWQQGAEGSAGDMALCLAKWDPTAAVPVLRRLALAADPSGIAGGARSNDGRFGTPMPGSEEYIAMLLVARIDAGDTAALDRYAAWLRGAAPEVVLDVAQPFPRVGDRRGRLLAPLWEHPDHPAIAATTEWLLGGDGSPWNPVVTPQRTPDDWISVEPLRSPLVTLPAFRKQVARLLEDRRVAGHVEVVSDEEIHTGVEGEKTLTRATDHDDPLCPPPGNKAVFRVCDVCACGLSSLGGAPECELFWPEPQRDRAVAACADYLRRYGHRLQVVPQTYPFGDPNHVQLVLPILNRPATPADVRRGDAVFSLAGRGEVRVCKMPRLPLVAGWKTQADHPVPRSEWDAASKTFKFVTGYEQDGVVWQAEELKVGGRWRRYYGFVGSRGLAKVPAEEIEFPWWGAGVRLPADAAVLDPMPLDDAFDIDWTPPGPGVVFSIGDPLVCRLLVRNRSGMERTLPPLALGGDRPDPDRETVTIDFVLCWMHPLAYSHWTEESLPWTPLAPKKPERFVLNQLPRALGPGEHFEILRCDLNEQFGPLRPGLYAFRMDFVKGKETRRQREPSVFFELVRASL